MFRRCLDGWIRFLKTSTDRSGWKPTKTSIERICSSKLAAAWRQTGRERRHDRRAQIVFCIDVRSESFRRHVEAQGPYETYGFAGFFGVTMNHQAFDSSERFPFVPGVVEAGARRG